MTFFWSKVCGPLGKTPYIYPRYQVWGVTDLDFDLAYYHPPLPNWRKRDFLLNENFVVQRVRKLHKIVSSRGVIEIGGYAPTRGHMFTLLS